MSKTKTLNSYLGEPDNKRTSSTKTLDRIVETEFPEFVHAEILLKLPPSFLNGEGTDTKRKQVVTRVKSFVLPKHGRIPYFSAQSLRRWLRETFSALSNSDKPEYYHRLYGVLKNPNITNPAGTTADPVCYLEDDLFGYTHPRIEHQELVLNNLELDRPKVVSVNRIAPLRTSAILGIPNESQISSDNGFVHLPDDSPLPYSTEFSTGFFSYSALLDLHSVGKYENIGDLLNLDPVLVTHYLGRKVIEEVKTGQPNRQTYRLTQKTLLERKKEALRLFLLCLKLIDGGAKTSQFGVDLTPRAVVLYTSKSANPTLMNCFKVHQGQVTIDRSPTTTTTNEGSLMHLQLGARLSLREKTTVMETAQNETVNITSVGSAFNAFFSEISGEELH